RSSQSKAAARAARKVRCSAPAASARAIPARARDARRAGPVGEGMENCNPKGQKGPKGRKGHKGLKEPQGSRARPGWGKARRAAGIKPGVSPPGRKATHIPKAPKGRRKPPPRRPRPCVPSGHLGRRRPGVETPGFIPAALRALRSRVSEKTYPLPMSPLRFRPPALAISPEARWMLLRAFGPVGALFPGTIEPAVALGL